MTIKKTQAAFTLTALAAAFVWSGGATAQTVNQGCTPAGSPSDNGAAPDSYTCAGAHPAGIAYTANGNLAVSNTASINAGTPGVDLTATGADTITFTSAGISGSGGVDLVTQQGALTVTHGSVAGGLRATTAGGNLTLNSSPAANNLVTAHITSGTGTLLVNLTGGSQGLLATDTVGGTGSTTINHGYSPFGPFRGMTVRAGTGGATLNLGQVRSFSAGPAVLVESAGAVVINGSGMLGIGASGTAPDNALQVSAPTLALTFAGNPDVPNSIEFFTAGIGRYDGSGAAPGSDGRSAIDLSGISESAALSFTSKSRWETSVQTSILSAGTNTVSIDGSSVLHTPYLSGGTALTTHVIDFNGGGTLTNAGTVMVGPVAASGAGGAPPPGERYSGPATELRIENLDTFNNSGTILLGAGLLFRGIDDARLLQGTDNWNDDILALPGAQFHGEEGSRILLDADLSSTLSQSSCDGGLRRANLDMPAADCVDLRNGGATGRTLIAVSDMSPGARGAYIPDGITLIDLAGADPADIDPEAFALSSESTRYTDLLGGAIDKGMFLVPLIYDAEAQQFKLQTLPSAIAFEQPMMASAAQELWRAASANWQDRQVQRRDAASSSGEGGGVWIRVANAAADRSVSSSTSGGGNMYTLNTAHDVNTWAATIGNDWVHGGGDSGTWVFGGLVGYSTGSLEFGAQAGNFRLDGMNIGLYGGYVGDALYADLLVNLQWFDLDQDQPGLNLQPSTAILNNGGESIGGQTEIGWRWRGGALSLAPHVFASLSTTTLDDVRVPGDDPLSDETFGGLNVKWEDARSRRVGVGVHGGYDLALDSVKLGLKLTGRLINEAEGNNSVAIQSPSGIDALVSDDFDGAFYDVIAGVTLGNQRGTTAGYLNVSLQSGDDYSRTGFSAGFRYQW